MKIKILVFITVIFFTATMIFIVRKFRSTSATATEFHDLAIMLSDIETKEEKYVANLRKIDEYAKILKEQGVRIDELKMKYSENPSSVQSEEIEKLKKEMSSQFANIERTKKVGENLRKDINKSKDAAAQREKEIKRSEREDKQSNLAIWFSLLGSIISSATTITVAIINKKKQV